MAGKEMARKKRKIKNRPEKRGFDLKIPASAHRVVPAVIAVAGATILLSLANGGASASFLFLIAVLGALCGVIGYDVLSRRAWEQETAEKIQNLTLNHDRLVREAARNRTDIAILKEGLADMAASVEQQGRRMHASGSAEAQMIETMVQRLGMLGEKPRARVETAYDGHILELELAPPPLRPLPLSPLDEALGADPASYSDSMVTGMIHRAVRNDDVDVYLQPIVSLPQRRARFYEAFARLRSGDGVIMPAGRYMALAQEEKMMPAIDNLLLLRCLHILRERRTENDGTPYIINVSVATLNDRGFMNDLVAFLSQHRRMAAQLVFELPQAEMEDMDGAMIQVLDGLSKLGCRFSMDRVRKRQLNVAQLKSRHVRFVKMDASWIIKEGRDKAGFSRIVRFKKQLDAAGIDLIVEKIENEGMLRELLDYSIDYGQGFLFGKPDIWTAYSDDRRAA